MPLSLVSYVIWAVVVFLPLHITAQTYKNITLGESLTAGDTSSSWLSPSNNFAFGFHETEPGKFLLAIWYSKIPEKTITWSANRDLLAPRGSKVTLSIDRSLQLTDPKGQEIWTASLAGSKSGAELNSAAMLDTGNFVLATQASAVLWQSFDEPTDTLLPTQVLNPSAQLVARYSEMNYSSGRFSLVLKDSGNSALYTTNFPLFRSLNSYYWAFEDQGLGFKVVFNQSGFLCVVARNGSILTEMFSNSQQARNSSIPGNTFSRVSEQVLYQRVILDFDGVLRHYVYKEQSTGWSVKAFTPDNICTAVIQQTGSGVCGYNSYCQLEDDSRPHCLCPPGYTQLDANNDMSGCSQNFAPQSCEEALHERNHFDFKVLQDVDWPLSDYEHFQNVTKDWCREVCLDDCFCAVGIFREGEDCWKKKLPLSNGKNHSSVDRTAFIKVRIAGGLEESKYKHINRVLIALLSTFGLAIIFLLGVIFSVIFFLAHRKRTMKGSDGRRAGGKYNVRSFSYTEIYGATNGFGEELGKGAFGVVYKGIIGELSGNQTFVAVKKLDSLLEDADKEFTAEVNAIGHTHHKNLVKLIGFCDEGEHRMLVYEFMSNGTLSDFLYRRPKPAWEKRLQIAQGIARGLCYLHEDCSTQIIHCDIKPQNILLDDDLNVRISDFGLAKLLRLDQTQTNTMARGTRGYVAPEWFKNMPITSKVDVYSFGTLLLEIISCRSNIHSGSNEEEGIVVLTDWAIDCYQMKMIDDLVDDDMEALSDKQRLERMVKIAIWCVQDDPCLRPTMKMVLQMLEEVVQVPEPPSVQFDSVPC